MNSPYFCVSFDDCVYLQLSSVGHLMVTMYGC